MNGIKKWYLSKALQGNIVTLLGFLVSTFNTPLLKNEVEPLVSSIFIIAGICYAVYGRIVARDTLE